MKRNQTKSYIFDIYEKSDSVLNNLQWSVRHKTNHIKPSSAYLSTTAWMHYLDSNEMQKSAFRPQSHYYVQFQTNNPEKCKNSLILSIMG